MTRPPLLAAFLVALIPSALAAQAATPEFDQSRFPVSESRYVIGYNGEDIGTAVATTVAENGIGSLDFRISAGMEQGSLVSFRLATFEMIESSSGGSVGPNSVQSSVTYRDGRVTGEGQMPIMGGGVDTVAIDTVLAPGTVDMMAIPALLMTLDMTTGRSYRVDAFDHSRGAVETMTMTVTGEETLTVPAGTFDTWAVDVTGIAEVPTYWMDRDTRIIVKMGPRGAPVTFELTETRNARR